MKKLRRSDDILNFNFYHDNGVNVYFVAKNKILL